MTEGLKWTVNEVPKSDDKHLELMSEENVKNVACPNSSLNLSEERTLYGSSLISRPSSFAI